MMDGIFKGKRNSAFLVGTYGKATNYEQVAANSFIVSRSIQEIWLIYCNDWVPP